MWVIEKFTTIYQWCGAHIFSMGGVILRYYLSIPAYCKKNTKRV